MSCVRSCSIYGSETWPMKIEHEVRLNRNEEYDQVDMWVYIEREEEKYRAHEYI